MNSRYRSVAPSRQLTLTQDDREPPADLISEGGARVSA